MKTPSSPVTFLVILVLVVIGSVLAQAPIQRQRFTTNTDPAAVVAVSNVVAAITLDSTNVMGNTTNTATANRAVFLTGGNNANGTQQTYSGGIWASNGNVLYWVTATKTNLISDGQ